jgi:hypothetical protein
MIAKLCVLCNECLTIALDSTCECTKVASSYIDDTLVIYCSDPSLVTLSKVWVNESNVIVFFKRYKDLGMSKLIPVNIKKGC